MKTFITVIIVAILMLLGFWFYLDHKCSEQEKANQLKMEEACKTAIDKAVANTVDSVNAHYALNQPLQRTHVFSSDDKKVTTSEKPSNMLVDKRDNQKYKTVEIHGHVWMAQNLNYKTPKSKCYDGKEANCDKYGRLYSWDEAMTACPQGWHLPNDAEWSDLINYYGGIWKAGAALRHGEQHSGFDALMAGYYDKKGFYGKLDEGTYFWSSTEINNDYASFKGIYKTADNVGTYTYTKADGFSVRCIKD